MKRFILEWGSLFCFGVGLAIAIAWGMMRYVDDQTHHFRIKTSGGVQNDLHFVFAAGHLTLCDQFETDSAGRIQPLIVEPRDLTPADIAKQSVARRGFFG